EDWTSTRHAATNVRVVYRGGRTAARILRHGRRLVPGTFILSGSARRDADPDVARPAGPGLFLCAPLHRDFGGGRAAWLSDRGVSLRFAWPVGDAALRLRQQDRRVSRSLCGMG